MNKRTRKKKNQEIYLDFVEKCELSDLTGSQIDVVKMLIENRDVLTKMGGFNVICLRVINYLKKNKEQLEEFDKSINGESFKSYDIKTRFTSVETLK